MDDKQYKIAVVGQRDSILLFRFIGFEIFPVKNPKEARDRVRQLAQNNYGIIYITEELMHDIADVVEYYNQQFLPAIIPIPTQEGSLGLALNYVETYVERAVGQNIL